VTLGLDAVAAADLVLCGAAVTAVTVRVTPRLAGRDGLDRLVVGLLLWMVQAVGVPLALACVDLLDRGAVLVAHVLIAGAVLRWVRRAPGRETTGALAPATIAATGAGAALAALWAVLSLRAAPTGDFDSREYHIANLATWLQHHNLWHLPYANLGQITATHPGNGEMFGLWLILPSHRDGLDYIGPLAFAVLAVVAVAWIAREVFGAKAAAPAALATMAVLFAPLFATSEIYSLETDIPAAAGVLLAIGFILRHRTDPSWRWTILAGVSLGLGVGAKYTALLPAVMVIAVALVICRDRRLLVGLIPGLVVFAGPWFLRNLVDTGNPVFPQQVAIGGHILLGGANTSIDVLGTSMLSHLVHFRKTPLKLWWTSVRTILGPAAVLPVVGVAIGWWRRRVPELTVLVLALGAFIAYLSTPFSGGGVTGEPYLVSGSIRYALLAMLLGVVLLAGALPQLVTMAAAAVIVAFDVWWLRKHRVSHPTVDPTHFMLAIAVVVGGAIIVALLARAQVLARRSDNDPVATRAWAMPAALAGLLGSFVVALAVLHRVDHPAIAPTEAVLDRLDPQSHPVLVVSVQDLRSVLGTDLDRGMVGVSNGGHADETPFSVRSEAAARFAAAALPGFATYSDPGSPEDAVLARRLDAELLSANLPILVVGQWADGALSAFGEPVRWVPPPTEWCLAAPPTYGIAVYTRLTPGATCPAP